MANSEAPRLNKSIEAKKADLEDKLRQLTRIRNENTLKTEKIFWCQEKDSKLLMNLKELIEQQQQVSRKQQGQNDKANQAMQLEHIKKLLHAPLYDKQFLDIFNSYLDKESRSYSRLTFSKKHRTESSSFISTFPTIAIKADFRQLQNQETMTICYDSLTTFDHLLELAFDFLQLEFVLFGDQLTIKPKSTQLRELELTDERGSKLAQEEFIQQFLLERGNSSNSQVMVILKRSNNEKEFISIIALESIKIIGAKGFTDHNLNIIQIQKGVTLRVSAYRAFFEFVPGLRYFMPEKEIMIQDDDDQTDFIKPIDVKKEPVDDILELYKLNDNHCCVISGVFIILALIIFQFTQFINPGLSFLKSQNIGELIDCFVDSGYYQIESSTDFWQYFNQKIVGGLYNSESRPNFFRENNEIVGALRLRQVKSRPNPCILTVQDYQKSSCFPKQFSEETEFRETLSSSTKNPYSWQKYQNSSQAGTLYLPQGTQTVFSGGGYIYDFERDLTSESIGERVDSLISKQFLDEKTAGVFVSFITFTPNSNIWIYFCLIFERNIHGQLLPVSPLIRIFSPNIFEGAQGQLNYITTMIKLTIACALIVYTLYRFKTLGFRFRYLLLEVGFLDCSSSILSIVSALLMFLQSKRNLNSQVLLNQQNFIDLYPEAENYNYCYIFVAMNAMMILLRLSIIFKSNERLNLAYSTLNQGLSQIMAYTFLIFSLIVGFTMVFQITLGVGSSYHSTFSGSLSQMVLTLQGNIKIEKLQPLFSQAFLGLFFLFYFFSVCYLTAAFQSFLIESFRGVILKDGYPQDKPQAPFKAKYIIHWAFSWILVWFYKGPQEHIHTASNVIQNDEEEIKLTLDRNGTNQQINLLN